jgi:ATP-binding cassette subfamily B (MDR/TAP) protein 1
MLGSMALGQAGPQFAVLGTAQGAATAIFDIIDRVFSCWKVTILPALDT